MSYPQGPYGGSPEWPGQQPPWPGQQPAGWPAPQPGWGGQPEPDNHLVWAILTTLFCCIPLGIVSLVYSVRVSGLWGEGRYAEAKAASDNAKKWAIIAAVVGVVVDVIGFVLWFAFVAAVVSNMPSITTSTSGY
jgi:interferon-induced transmembrane protein